MDVSTCSRNTKIFHIRRRCVIDHDSYNRLIATIVSDIICYYFDLVVATLQISRIPSGLPIPIFVVCSGICNVSRRDKTVGSNRCIRHNHTVDAYIIFGIAGYNNILAPVGTLGSGRREVHCGWHCILTDFHGCLNGGLFSSLSIFSMETNSIIAGLQIFNHPAAIVLVVLPSSQRQVTPVGSISCFILQLDHSSGQIILFVACVQTGINRHTNVGVFFFNILLFPSCTVRNGQDRSGKICSGRRI